MQLLIAEHFIRTFILDCDKTIRFEHNHTHTYITNPMSCKECSMVRFTHFYFFVSVEKQTGILRMPTLWKQAKNTFKKTHVVS